MVIFSRSHEVPKYFIQEVFSSLVCMGACQNWNRSWEERGGDTSELEESGHWFSVIISGKFCILFLYLPKHLSYLGTSPKASQFHTNIYRNIQYSQEVCNVQFFCCCCEEANIIQAKQQFLKTPLSGRKYLYEVVYCALQLGRVIFTFCDFQKWAYC